MIADKRDFSARPRSFLVLRLVATWVLILSSSLGLLSATVRAQSVVEDMETLDKLMKKTSVKYTKSGVAYVAVFQGKSLNTIPIVIVADDAAVTIIAVVAEKTRFKKTSELIEQLAIASMDNTLLKVGLVKAGEMVVRIDALLETLDSEDLEKLINKTALGADKIYKQFSSHIK